MLSLWDVYRVHTSRYKIVCSLPISPTAKTKHQQKTKQNKNSFICEIQSPPEFLCLFCTVVLSPTTWEAHMVWEGLLTKMSPSPASCRVALSSERKKSQGLKDHLERKTKWDSDLLKTEQHMSLPLNRGQDCIIWRSSSTFWQATSAKKCIPAQVLRASSHHHPQ